MDLVSDDRDIVAELLHFGLMNVEVMQRPLRAGHELGKGRLVDAGNALCSGEDDRIRGELESRIEVLVLHAFPEFLFEIDELLFECLGHGIFLLF